jgi:hypothetical protein
MPHQDLSASSPGFSLRAKSLGRGVAVVALPLVLAVGLVLALGANHRIAFLVGGALINLGYYVQDPLDTYDLQHHEQLSPQMVWMELLRQNRAASFVRDWFPRTARHPLVAMVVCMDARIDTNELTGDTRRFYYVLRTAGSVLDEKEQDMLELAVEAGVKVVVFTTHSDCAAEGGAASPDFGQRFPALVRAMGERKRRQDEFLARPAIASRIASGALLVKSLHIDTTTERMFVQPLPDEGPAHACGSQAAAHPTD